MVARRVVGGRSFERKGCLSRAKREACIRRLCSTVVYDYLLTAVFLVSAALCVANLRPTCIYVQRSRGAPLSGLLVACDITPPAPPHIFGERCVVERQRRVFTSLRSYNSGRQTGKSFFFSLSFLLLLLLPLFPFRFPQALFSSTFLANLGEVLQGSCLQSSTLSRVVYDFEGGWLRERERLDSAAIPLSATLSRLDCRDTSIVAQHRSSCSLGIFKTDYRANIYFH